MYDPTLGEPPGTYGLELEAGRTFRATFYTSANSEEQAWQVGRSWLASLRYKFLGLDGSLEVFPRSDQLTTQEVENLLRDDGLENLSNTCEDRKNSKQEKLFEISFPNGLLRKKINPVEKFVNLFYQKSSSHVHAFLAWQRSKTSFGPIEEVGQRLSRAFKIRMFFWQEMHRGNDLFLANYINDQVQDKNNFPGLLSFMTLNLETCDGIPAKIIKVRNLSRDNMYRLRFFDDPKAEFFLLNERELSFDFPEDMPLPRFPIVQGENVRYIDLSNQFVEKAVSVGTHLKDGVVTNHEVYVPIDKLPQDVAIFGKSGSGKTFFLARFVQELVRKAKQVGILVLNLSKTSQEIFYPDFRIVRYSDDGFSLPYHFEPPGTPREKLLQETATFICASLGLKNVFEKILYRTQVGFYRKLGSLPEHFFQLLSGVENYIRNNPYGPEEQANLLQVFRNRKNVFDEEKINEVLKKCNSLPEWLKNWFNGENIFLDLAECSKFVKPLLVNCLFQVVRTVTKDEIFERLKHLIVIDEAHAILEKPITNNSDDSDFIVKEQMSKIFSKLLKEYRSRGVGFVLADQSPSTLFGDVVTQPSVKVIFRQDYPNNLLFSESSDERQSITQFPNRIALILNGATGEKYLIKTIDINIFRLIEKN
ncbi:MAG: ATP-binding protein [Candidatus Lokiarchaeota archaeon]|nr:ATP-binding protein [Candidatus Lokiarchaeota archaeon]